eukprot:2143847-Prymnesium_polylepis.1
MYFVSPHFYHFKSKALNFYRTPTLWRPPQALHFTPTLGNSNNSGGHAAARSSQKHFSGGQGGGTDSGRTRSGAGSDRSIRNGFIAQIHNCET